MLLNIKEKEQTTMEKQLSNDKKSYIAVSQKVPRTRSVMVCTRFEAVDSFAPVSWKRMVRPSHWTIS